MSIWNGDLEFGLLQIPVSVEMALKETRPNFKLFDKKTGAPIGHKRVNKNTGEEVPYEQIVKGLEYEKGQFVMLTEEDFQRVDPSMAHTISILNFIDLKEIDPTLYDHPYYLFPRAKGVKGLELLRRALLDTQKVALATIVLKVKLHLCLIFPREDGLVLETLRWPEELRSLAQERPPLPLSEDIQISLREMRLAQQLVHVLSSPWDPEQYQNTYLQKLFRLIDQKIQDQQLQPEAAKDGIKAGDQVDNVSSPLTEEQKVVDLVPLIKKSIEENTPARKTSPTSSS